MKGSSDPSNAVTAYDVEKDEWHHMLDLQSPRANCSAIVQQQRYIYLMPGTNLGASKASSGSLLIDYLDCGPANEISPSTLILKQWVQLEVNNPSFYRQ